jgi:hypothetical protein
VFISPQRNGKRERDASGGAAYSEQKKLEFVTVISLVDPPVQSRRNSEGVARGFGSE